MVSYILNFKVSTESGRLRKFKVVKDVLSENNFVLKTVLDTTAETGRNKTPISDIRLSIPLI